MLNTHTEIKPWNYQVKSKTNYGPQSTALLNKKIDRLIDLLKDLVEEERGLTDMETSYVRQVVKERNSQ